MKLLNIEPLNFKVLECWVCRSEFRCTFKNIDLWGVQNQYVWNVNGSPIFTKSSDFCTFETEWSNTSFYTKLWFFLTSKWFLEPIYNQDYIVRLSYRSIQQTKNGNFHWSKCRSSMIMNGEYKFYSYVYIMQLHRIGNRTRSKLLWCGHI